MPELKMISPLLDGMVAEREVGDRSGRACYIVRNSASERFVLKRMSVPAADSQIRALILSGAYPTEAAVHEYYTRVVTDIRLELDKGRELAASGQYAGALGYQIEPKADGIGYDVYILYPLFLSLSDFLVSGSISQLRAVNLGLDLCDALSVCREAGYLYANLKPENVYLMPTGKSLLGDLGLAAVQDLRYTCIPEDYIGSYSAPELSDFTLTPNTTIDLYSLGMVLYRIYNGNHGPFVDENTSEAMADKLRLSGKPLPSPIYADYELAGIILKACAFKKEDRYQTPEELKQALTLYMQRNEVSDAPVVPPIVAAEPIADLEESVDEADPIRMTEADALDEKFRSSFAPDLSGGGTEDDIDPAAAAKATAEAPSKPSAPPVAPTPVVSAPVAPTPIATPAAPTPAPEAAAPSDGNTETADETPAELSASPAEAGHDTQAAEAVTKEADKPAEAAAPTVPAEEAPAVTAPEAESAPAPEAKPEAKPEVKPEPAPTTESTPEPAPAPTVEAIEPQPSAPSAPSQSGKPQASDASADDVDPDQIGWDELLASIDRIVAEPDPAPLSDIKMRPIAPPESVPTSLSDDSGLTLTVSSPEPPQDYIDIETDEPHAEEAPHKRSRWLPITVIIALLAAIGGVVWFLLNWYFVDMTQLNVLSVSTSQMVVELISADSADRFVLNCTDSYGNAYPGIRSDNHYTFSGLSEKTSYSISVNAAQYHRLRNAEAYTLNVTTPESTVISEFVATRGSEDGKVMVTFLSDGPSPSQWHLTCSADDGTVQGNYYFVGNSYVISGLVGEKLYTFTLSCDEDIYLSGETTAEYEVLPLVEAKNLKIAQIKGDEVTLTWEQGENTPSVWYVRCEAKGMEAVTVQSEECSCTLTLPDFEREYLFRLYAKGMDLTPELTLPVRPIIVDGLTAVAHDDGTVTVSWDTPAGVPEGGWYVAYNTVGSLHAAYLPSSEDGALKESTVTLEGLVPNTQYEITLALTSADSSSAIFGQTTVTVTTATCDVFTEYGITPEPPFTASSALISLWAEPSNEDWTYYDLNDHRNTFSAEESIAVCIEVNAVNASDDTVTLLYAVRDENGQIVNDVSRDLAWNDLWYNRRHANAVPLPAAQGKDAVPGNYTLEVYVNGKLLASIGFTVT